jgi:Flp pilus assembly protein TadD/class 3 adenylate cyclase
MDKPPVYYSIVFTDLVASKLATGYLPDYVYQMVLMENSRIALDTASYGRGLKGLPFQPTNLGDGNLFFFNQIDDALVFALSVSANWAVYWEKAVQPRLKTYPNLAAHGNVLKMRIGAHLGNIHHEELPEFSAQTRFSRAINTAFVLQNQAPPGGVVATETALSLTQSRLFERRPIGRFDPLDRGEDAPDEDRLTYYEVTGMGDPPKYDGVVEDISDNEREKVALDWFWKAFAFGRNPVDNAKTVECYREAIRFNPNLPDAWCNLGVHLSIAGEMEEAVQVLLRAAELDPQNPRVFANLGSGLNKTGRLDEALTACRRALELNENFDMAHYNLGVVHLFRDELAEAEKAFRRAVELNSYFRQALYNLTCVLAMQGRADEALKYLKRAIAVYPPYAKQAAADEDLRSLRDDPRFTTLVRDTVKK